MTGTTQAPSTYDRMLAEIEMESDDDKHDSSTEPRPHKAEAKAKANVRQPRSRRESRSLDDERKDEYDSADESDEDKETRVRPRDIESFDGQANAAHPQHGPALDARSGNLRSFVTRAPPSGASSLRCYVERDRHGLNRFNPLYRLFLDDGKQHLLTAQKRGSSKTSNYLLSLHRTTVDRRSALVVAKLRANWSGSTYTLFDGGLNPAKTAIDTSVRKILGLIECAYDEMGPGRLNVRLPSVHENGSPSIQWKDTACHDDHDARKVFESTLDATSLLLRNKRPEYVAASGGHVLDFHGRVNMPSVKNFQMQSDAQGDDMVLQFGRISCQPPGPHRQCECHKDTFTMDLSHPLSPVQAFAICLAALDGKVADAKAFERVTSIIRRLSS